MDSEPISQQHFILYLICISIVALLDASHYIITLVLKKNKNDTESSESDKPKKPSYKNKYKGTLKSLYLAKFVPNILAIVIYYIFPSTRYYSVLPSSLSFILGILIFITGFVIRQISIIQRGTYFTSKVSTTDDPQIIYTGIYAFIRHPAYTGTFLELTGAAIFYNHFNLSWLLSTPYLIAVLDRIQYDEMESVKKFGEKYREYMTRAGMIFPKFN
jgi:protein-S-isoprenylcysteine O-methyltransferase Ste14